MIATARKNIQFLNYPKPYETSRVFLRKDELLKAGHSSEAGESARWSVELVQCLAFEPGAIERLGCAANHRCVRKLNVTCPFVFAFASCIVMLFILRESIAVLQVDTEPFGMHWGPFAGTLDVCGRLERSLCHRDARLMRKEYGQAKSKFFRTFLLSPHNAVMFGPFV